MQETVAAQLKKLMRATPSLDTQEKIAARTGLGQSTISRYLRGEGNPTSDNLQKIADAFNVSVAVLHGEEPGGAPAQQDAASLVGEIVELVTLFSQCDAETRQTILRFIRATARVSSGLAADRDQTQR